MTKMASPHNRMILLAILSSASLAPLPLSAADKLPVPDLSQDTQSQDKTPDATGNDAMAEGMSLNDALIMVYARHPKLLAERATLRATDEQLAQAEALGRPSLNGFAQLEQSYTTYTGAVNPFTTQGNLTTASYGAEFEQPLYQGMKVIRARSRAEAQVEAGRADLRSVEQDALYEGATAYLDVLTTREVLRLTETNHEKLEKEPKAAQSRLDHGKGTRTDLFQTKARLAGAKSDMIRAKADLVAATATFKRVVGIAPGSLQPIRKFAYLPHNKAVLMAQAKRHNANLVAARAARDASAAAVALAKSELHPSVSAIASYSYTEGATFDDDERERISGGVRVTVPIYQGGARYSDIRRAQQELQVAEFTLIDLEQSVEESVATAWDNLQAAYANIAAAKTQVEAAEFALAGVRAENEHGKRTVLDVLDAEQELLDAQTDYVDANKVAALAVYSVLTITGTMTAKGLRLETPRYDPSYNAEKVKRQWVGF